MGSTGNSNQWAPYDNYRDCSQGICSIYCPQWCYIIFPPPPPFRPHDDGSGTNFSPLVIAVIGILASAFLLVSYYTIVSKYCRRRRVDPNTSAESELNLNQLTHEQLQVASTTGLDEMVIKSIAVCKYNKEEGLVEGTECSVCLNEFQEDESLRLLPKCSHAFHLACIDTWLRSHSNCPLCRAIVSSTTVPLPLPASSPRSTLTVSSLQIQRRDDLVIVIDDGERLAHQEEVAICHVSTHVPSHTDGNGEAGVQQFRRSISLGSFSCQRHLLVADILRIEEDDEGLQLQEGKFPSPSGGIGSSKEEESKPNNRNAGWGKMKRSISAGRIV